MGEGRENRFSLFFRDDLFSCAEMRECAGCGFPLEAMGVDVCPKCDYVDLRRETREGVLTVDIAHNGETWEMALEKLKRSLDDAIYYDHSCLKVIHGYGSGGRESVIGPLAQRYLKHWAEENGGRFVGDRHTHGASLVWLNR